MKSHAAKSIGLFALSAAILVITTLAESSLGVMSLTIQRVITFVGLVLPAISGFIFGIMSLAQKEGHPWLASAGMILNGLFAAFHLLIFLFAG